MSIVSNKDGYWYDPDGLRQVASMFHGAADKVDPVLKAIPKDIDAGASSDYVAKAITTLTRLAAQGTLAARQVADKVHATDGSYADVEDTNAAGLKAWNQPR